MPLFGCSATYGGGREPCFFFLKLFTLGALVEDLVGY